jgi:uncharacterized membrane protein
MESDLQLLALLAIFVAIAVPIVAIVAFVRAGAAQKTAEQIPRLTSRIWELERQIKTVDQKLSAFTAQEAHSATPTEGHAAAAKPHASTQEPKAQPVALAPTKAPEPAPPLFRASVPPSAAPPVPTHAVVTPPPQTASMHRPKPEGSVDSHSHTPAAPQPTQTAEHGLHAAPPSTSPAAPPKPPSPPHPPHHVSPPPPPPSQPGETDVESMIAGRWFNYVGILAVGLATTFFLKYAFDNNWIGPGGRVTIGLLVGAAMYPLSQWVYKRGYQYYSEGLAGLGAGILYLSVWAGWHYYHIFPQSYAFPLMIAITAATAAVAYGRDSERIAVLALIGGLLTPILVSTGANEEVALFSYVLVLAGGMLAIAWVKKWKWIVPLQFAGTLLYFSSWYGEFYARYELDTTLLFATLFFVLFAAIPAVRCTQEGELPPLDITIVLTNAFQFLTALHLMLWPQYKWGMTFAVLALAAGHLLAERALPRKATPANQLAHSLYAGLALTFATLAIPIRIEGKWITIAFAVEGALLIWSGLKIRSMALRTAGFVLFIIVAIRLLVLLASAPAPDTFLLNERFLTLMIAAVCWMAAFFFAQQSNCDVGTGETQVYYSLAVAANFVMLVALSMEVWDLFGRTSMGIDRVLAQELALSVLWIGYALALIAGGMAAKSAATRWQGLGLLGVAIGKVFFFDLSFLTRFYRIVSFFVLGLVLLLVSFYYQRRTKTAQAAKRS